MNAVPSGSIGMNVSVRTNVCTAEAVRAVLNEALAVAVRGGAITMDPLNLWR